MKYHILSGGSGVWNLQVDGTAIASGHVPTHVPGSEREVIIRRQIAAKAAGRRPRLEKRSLGGGHLDLVELDPQDVETLASAARAEKERREELTRRAEEERLAAAMEVVRREVDRRLSAGWQVKLEKPDRVIMTRDSEIITIAASPIFGEENAWVRQGEYRSW